MVARIYGALVIGCGCSVGSSASWIRMIHGAPPLQAAIQQGEQYLRAQHDPVASAHRLGLPDVVLDGSGILAQAAGRKSESSSCSHKRDLTMASG